MVVLRTCSGTTYFVPPTQRITRNPSECHRLRKDRDHLHILETGCDDFKVSLTTNGMCNTFNGKHSSELWKTSDIMNSFSHLFTSNMHNDKTFGGPRTVQGILFSNHLLYYKTLLGKRSACKRNLLQNFLFIK